MGWMRPASKPKEERLGSKAKVPKKPQIFKNLRIFSI